MKETHSLLPGADSNTSSITSPGGGGGGGGGGGKERTYIFLIGSIISFPPYLPLLPLISLLFSHLPIHFCKSQHSILRLDSVSYTKISFRKSEVGWEKRGRDLIQKKKMSENFSLSSLTLHCTTPITGSQEVLH